MSESNYPAVQGLETTTQPTGPSHDLVPQTFPILSGEDPIELLLSRLQLVSTEEEAIRQVADWIEGESKNLTPAEHLEPNIKLQYFFQHTSSLVELALRFWPRIEVQARHYSMERLKYLAQLLIAIRLIVRYREQAEQKKMTSATIDKIAAVRGWSTTADVVQELVKTKDRLLTMGAAALIDQPQVIDAYLASQNENGFAGAFNEVRRRVDIAGEYRDLFEAVGVTSQTLQDINQLLQDADSFYRSREERVIFSKKLTELRDKAFTLASQEIRKLQYIMRAVTYGDETLSSQIDGKFWRRLNKISRKRRSRQEQGTDKPADQGATTSLGQQSTTPGSQPTTPGSQPAIPPTSPT